MDPELKEELRLEELDEIASEPMNIWIEEHQSSLEEQFLKLLPPEDQPLDDDIPDLLDELCDEFRLFAEKVYLVGEQ